MTTLTLTQEFTMDDTPRSPDWEAEIADLLAELSTTQEELLDVLAQKRDAMATGALDRLDEVQTRELELGVRLEACHQRRTNLLAQAAQQGLPGDSITQLAGAAQGAASASLSQQAEQISARTKLLRHQSLTNWVLAQRSMLHLSQLLEILATGGRTKPTYSKEEAAHSRGALVDRAA